MAYPTSLDSFTANVDNVDVIYASDVNELQTAIQSLESKVGVDGSAVTTSHDYKLSGVTGSNKAVPNNGGTLANPKITVGSDAVGDIHFTSNVDGTQSRLPIVTGKVLKSTGGVLVWEDEIATVNASTTVKGVFEAATQAETTAGTATGGTGAVLVVTPDSLAGSTPVFDGSALTGIASRVVASNNLKHSADTERTTTSGTNALVKSFTINNPGIIRLKYDIKASVSNTRVDIIYGSSAGPILSSDSTASATYVTKTADIYVPCGMKLDIYFRVDSGTGYIQNCRVYYDLATYSTGSVVTD